MLSWQGRSRRNAWILMKFSDSLAPHDGEKGIMNDMNEIFCVHTIFTPM